MPAHNATVKRDDAAGESPADPRARFARDVEAGLSRRPKVLPCVYFYDRIGSLIFEKICRQPEYYCTRAEAEILKRRSAEIAASCRSPVRVVELGSGNSAKTRILIDSFIDSGKPVRYCPIDISADILKESSEALDRSYTLLKVQPIVASYEDGLDRLDPSDGTTLLLWLGSSIGNFEPTSAAEFLRRVSGRLATGDRLLVGIDLIKDPAALEAAYNDRAGVTASFNLNLLARINRELNGDFRLNHFRHRAVFNPGKGRVEMYLVSRCKQSVHIGALDLTVSFSPGESVHTENSYKYTIDGIRALGENAGLHQLGQWLDSGERFSLNIFEVVGPQDTIEERRREKQKRQPGF